MMGGYSRIEHKYLQFGPTGGMHPIRLAGFKKEMKRLFINCPLIISRLDSKVYNFENWETMVNDYNFGMCK